MSIKNDGLLSLSFQNDTCFKTGEVGFDEIKPINLIIGKNNSGKSQLINCLELYVKNKIKNPTEYNEYFIFSDEAKLYLNKSISNYLHNGYNSIVAENAINRTLNYNGTQVTSLSEQNLSFNSISFQNDLIKWVKEQRKCWTTEKIFRRINAERDIVKEEDRQEKIKIENVTANGNGITTLLTQVYNLTEYAKNEKSVRQNVLDAFNEIIGKDAKFLRIETKRTATEDSTSKPRWQIHLEQENKGLVELDNSGSGLKTILLVIINLILIPQILEKPLSSFIFAFEELENNLHPSLFRRLLSFISKKIIEGDSTLFLTTHSNIALDFFSPEEKAQIIIISHNGEYAVSNTVVSLADKTNIINELGAKASDILQANGIIWVEGPSDRIYINKWISLIDSSLIEGRDYQCAFYGGSLLSNLDINYEEQKLDSQKVDLLKVNRNIYIVCDSDKNRKRGHFKKRVTHIKEIVDNLKKSDVDVGLWITDGREIENYLTSDVIKRCFENAPNKSPEQYEKLFPSAKDKSETYLQKATKRKNIDKVELAMKLTKDMQLNDFKNRFNWQKEMESLVKAIKRWNE